MTFLIHSPLWLTKPEMGFQPRPVEPILWLTSHHSDSLLRTGINKKRDFCWDLVLNPGALSSCILRELVSPSTRIGNLFGERMMNMLKKKNKEIIRVLRDGEKGAEIPWENKTEMKKDWREETFQTQLCASHFNSLLLSP